MKLIPPKSFNSKIESKTRTKRFWEALFSPNSLLWLQLLFSRIVNDIELCYICKNTTCAYDFCGDCLIKCFKEIDLISVSNQIKSVKIFDQETESKIISISYNPFTSDKTWVNLRLANDKIIFFIISIIDEFGSIDLKLNGTVAEFKACSFDNDILFNPYFRLLKSLLFFKFVITSDNLISRPVSGYKKSTYKALKKAYDHVKDIFFEIDVKNKEKVEIFKEISVELEIMKNSKEFMIGRINKLATEIIDMI